MARSKQKKLVSCAQSAKYMPVGSSIDRTRVNIQGLQMKDKCAPADVESKGLDEQGNETPVRPARGIVSSDKLQCEAELFHHSKAHDKVMVRIRCSNGSFSDWIEAEK